MARGAYYNEIDPYCVEWLRNLISAGLIPDGDVDSRSIEVVSPDDLSGYTQCHFFAGLGGWAYAARLAGWPDDRALWTGSCPCQPFSVAGKGAWDDWQLIGPDREGKYRRIKPGITPLAPRLPGHVGQLRAYGNAICAPVAAEVIRAWMETSGMSR
jgi:site-specific DNA-cytosine methylase